MSQEKFWKDQQITIELVEGAKRTVAEEISGILANVEVLRIEFGDVNDENFLGYKFIVEVETLNHQILCLLTVGRTAEGDDSQEVRHHFEIIEKVPIVRRETPEGLLALRKEVLEKSRFSVEDVLCLNGVVYVLLKTSQDEAGKKTVEICPLKDISNISDPKSTIINEFLKEVNGGIFIMKEMLWPSK